MTASRLWLRYNRHDRPLRGSPALVINYVASHGDCAGYNTGCLQCRRRGCAGDRTCCGTVAVGQRTICRAHAGGGNNRRLARVEDSGAYRASHGWNLDGGNRNHHINRTLRTMRRDGYGLRNHSCTDICCDIALANNFTNRRRPGPYRFPIGTSAVQHGCVATVNRLRVS